MLSRNLAKATVWESHEDRRSREEMEQHILPNPINLISSRFIPVGIPNLESKRTQLSPWRALTMVFMAVLTIPYFSMLTVVPSWATYEEGQGSRSGSIIELTL